MFDELRYNVRQAAHLRMAQSVLDVHPAKAGEDAADLRHRLRSALALVDAAYVEVGRLERLRKGNRDDPSPAA